jgi:hypothetical protein
MTINDQPGIIKEPIMDDDQSKEIVEATDYFVASLDQGELIMEPYCRCGEALEEDYFCSTCKRQCQCVEVRCASQETLEFVQDFLKGNERFRNFRAVLHEA